MLTEYKSERKVVPLTRVKHRGRSSRVFFWSEPLIMWDYGCDATKHLLVSAVCDFED